MLLTPVSGRYVQNDEPQLVSWGIRRVLFPDAKGRLLAAADAGADSALALYAVMRRSYPDSTLDESTLNTLGYAMMRTGGLQDALKVFQRNVAECPNAANPHRGLRTEVNVAVVRNRVPALSEVLRDALLQRAARHGPNDFVDDLPVLKKKDRRKATYSIASGGLRIRVGVDREYLGAPRILSRERAHHGREQSAGRAPVGAEVDYRKTGMVFDFMGEVGIGDCRSVAHGRCPVRRLEEPRQ